MTKLSFIVLLIWSVSIQANSFQKAWDSVVRIEVKNKETRDKVSFGTGFVFDNKGLVFTNFHVVKNLEKIKSLYHYASKKEFAANEIEVRCVDRVHDIAILKIKSDRFSQDGSVLSTEEYVEENEILNDVGIIENKPMYVAYHTLNSHRLKKPVTINNYGMIAELYNVNLKESDKDKNYSIYLMNHVTGPGSSGGPVFTDNGRLVAMLAGGVNDIDVFSIPAKYLHKKKNEGECKKTDTEKIRTELKSDFASEFYKVMFKTYASRLSSYREEIFLRGEVVERLTRHGVSGARVRLLRSEGGAIIDSGLEENTSNVGWFNFNVSSSIDTEWFVEVSHDHYKMPSGKSQEMLGFKTRNAVEVIDRDYKNLMLKAEPTKINVGKVKNKEEFKVQLYRNRGSSVTEETDIKGLRWKLCKDTESVESCEVAVSPKWLKMKSFGKLGKKYDVKYINSAEDADQDEINFRVEFVKRDLYGSKYSSYDELAVEKEEHETLVNVDETYITPYIIGDNNQLLLEDVKLKVLVEFDGKDVGGGELADAGNARTSGKLTYKLKYKSGLSKDNLDVIFEIKNVDRYSFFDGNNEKKAVKRKLKEKHVLLVRKLQ